MVGSSAAHRLRNNAFDLLRLPEEEPQREVGRPEPALSPLRIPCANLQTPAKEATLAPHARDRLRIIRWVLTRVPHPDLLRHTVEKIGQQKAAPIGDAKGHPPQWGKIKPNPIAWAGGTGNGPES